MSSVCCGCQKNKLSKFIASGRKHTCATCPHIDTFCWPDIEPQAAHSYSYSMHTCLFSLLQLQVPRRALFLFMLGRHMLTMLHHVQRTCCQTNYRGTASPAGISKSTLSNAIKSCWTCRNINLTFYCPGRGPRVGKQQQTFEYK